MAVEEAGLQKDNDEDGTVGDEDDDGKDKEHIPASYDAEVVTMKDRAVVDRRHANKKPAKVVCLGEGPLNCRNLHALAAIVRMQYFDPTYAFQFRHLSSHPRSDGDRRDPVAVPQSPHQSQVCAALRPSSF